MTTPRFINPDPQALARRLTRATDEELLISHMALAVQEELGRPLTPAELADVRASATELIGKLERHARLPDAEQRALAREAQDEDGAGPA